MVTLGDGREANGRKQAKIFTPEEKLQIVLAGLKGEAMVTELCRRYGISQPTYYTWRDKMLSGAAEALSGPGTSIEVTQLCERVANLSEPSAKRRSTQKSRKSAREIPVSRRVARARQLRQEGYRPADLGRALAISRASIYRLAFAPPSSPDASPPPGSRRTHRDDGEVGAAIKKVASNLWVPKTAFTQPTRIRESGHPARRVFGP